MTLHMLKPKNKQKYFRQRVVRDLGTTKSFCLDKMTQEKKKKKNTNNPTKVRQAQGTGKHN